PTIDARKPAGSPAVYQPTARPIQPATTDPAIPNKIVMIIPPGSRPGMMSLAITPTTKPIIIIQSTCMAPTPLSNWVLLPFHRKNPAFTQTRHTQNKVTIIDHKKSPQLSYFVDPS